MPNGRLFYVIGASGSGKKTLVQHVRERLRDSVRLIFAHRYITRPAQELGENHVILTEQEYEHRLQIGLFAMHWYSHGDSFAIGVEINQWLGKGLDVVVIGSRGYLQRATMDYPELVPVLLTASIETLKRRLRLKGLQDDVIERRLRRAHEFQMLAHPQLAIVHNDGLLESASNEFCKLLCGRQK